MKARYFILVWIIILLNCSLAPTKKINVEIHFATRTLNDAVSPKLHFDPATGDSFYVYTKVEFSNYDIKSAEVFTYRVNPALALNLTEEGALKLSQLTRVNRGQRLAIFFNSRLVAAPIIIKPILFGKLIVEGDYNKNQFEKWAKGINKAIGD